MTKKMGYEGLAYYGAAGSTASTQLTGSRDISYSIDLEKGDTTARGSGSSPPIKVERVCRRAVQIEITFPNESSDTSLEALRVAAAAGTPIALRLKDYAAGKGFDGDCTLSVSMPYPMDGEQVVTFSATPTDESGRTPSLYS